MADDVALDDAGNLIGEYVGDVSGGVAPEVQTPDTSTPEGSPNTAPTSQGFNWGGLDAFINDLDQQAAAWYVLTKQPTPTPRTLPPALGGPRVLPTGSIAIGNTVATIPPIVWMAAALVVLVFVLRK